MECIGSVLAIAFSSSFYSFTCICTFAKWILRPKIISIFLFHEIVM